MEMQKTLSRNDFGFSLLTKSNIVQKLDMGEDDFDMDESKDEEG